MLLFFPFFGLWIFSLVFWILKIVEVARIPDDQYRAARTEKVTWVLIVVLLGIIGALVWQFSRRTEVLAVGGGYTMGAPALAYGAPPMTPAGWYPEPGTNGLRWWDGARWTEHRQPPAPPTPPTPPASQDCI